MSANILSDMSADGSQAAQDVFKKILKGSVNHKNVIDSELVIQCRHSQSKPFALLFLMNNLINKTSDRLSTEQKEG